MITRRAFLTKLTATTALVAVPGAAMADTHREYRTGWITPNEPTLPKLYAWEDGKGWIDYDTGRVTSTSYIMGPEWKPLDVTAT